MVLREGLCGKLSMGVSRLAYTSGAISKSLECITARLYSVYKVLGVCVISSVFVFVVFNNFAYSDSHGTSGTYLCRQYLVRSGEGVGRLHRLERGWVAAHADRDANGLEALASLKVSEQYWI